MLLDCSPCSFDYITLKHGGAVGSTVALQQEGTGVFLLGVQMFSMCMHGFPLESKTWAFGFSKLPLDTNVCVDSLCPVSPLPCDELVTHSECTPPLAR